MEHPFFAPSCIFPAMVSPHDQYNVFLALLFCLLLFFQETKKALDKPSILLLKKVRKGKSRDQDNQKGKVKHIAKDNVSTALSKVLKH